LVTGIATAKVKTLMIALAVRGGFKLVSAGLGAVLASYIIRQSTGNINDISICCCDAKDNCKSSLLPFMEQYSKSLSSLYMPPKIT
jgi:hypothetical protein